MASGDGADAVVTDIPDVVVDVCVACGGASITDSVVLAVAAETATPFWLSVDLKCGCSGL